MKWWWWWCHKCRQFSVEKHEHHENGWWDGTILSLPCLCKGSLGQTQIISFFRWFSDVVGWSLVVPKGNWVSTSNQNRCTFQIHTETEIDFHRINFIRKQPLSLSLSLPSFIRSLCFHFLLLLLLHFHPGRRWAKFSAVVQWYTAGITMCVYKTLASDWNWTSFSMSCKFTLYRYSRVNSSISQKCTSAMFNVYSHQRGAAVAFFSMFHSIRFCSILHNSLHFLLNDVQHAKHGAHSLSMALGFVIFCGLLSHFSTFPYCVLRQFTWWITNMPKSQACSQNLC